MPCRVDKIDRIRLDIPPAIQRVRTVDFTRPGVSRQEASHAGSVVPRAQVDQAAGVGPLAGEAVSAGAVSGGGGDDSVWIIRPRKGDCANRKIV
jgi:hypothetical protein